MLFDFHWHQTRWYFRRINIWWSSCKTLMHSVKLLNSHLSCLPKHSLWCWSDIVKTFTWLLTFERHRATLDISVSSKAFMAPRQSVCGWHIEVMDRGGFYIRPGWPPGRISTSVQSSLTSGSLSCFESGMGTHLLATLWPATFTLLQQQSKAGLRWWWFKIRSWNNTGPLYHRSHTVPACVTSKCWLV